MNKPVNLVVYLARSGIGSRRACDELVRSGAVTVNGKAVDFPRLKLNGDEVVAVNGDPVEVRELRYMLVNKPRGVASTRRDPHAERVVVDLVPDGRTLFPVGRLDVDTTGLIILTNDGVLANHLMHPRYGVPKTYVARVRGKVSRRALSTLRQGIELDDGPTAAAEVNLKKQSAKTALVEITIHEGRKRQVRRMFEAVGLPVEELHRRRYGPLTDKGLEPGASRELTEEEVDALRRAGEEVERESQTELEGESLFLSAEVERLETEPVRVLTTPTRGEREDALTEANESNAQVELEAEQVATRFDAAEAEPENEAFSPADEDADAQGEDEVRPGDVASAALKETPRAAADTSMAAEATGAVAEPRASQSASLEPTAAMAESDDRAPEGCGDDADASAPQADAGSVP